jgi:hypothetical protein
MDSYEYQLKMFSAIFRSSVRNHAEHILDTKSLVASSYLIADYISYSLQAVSKFRDLYRIVDVPTVPDKVRGYFRMCDEFIGHCLDIHTIELIKKIESSSESLELTDLRNQLVAIVADERKYKHSADYGILNGEGVHDRRLIYHRGMLKKFIESELYIRLDKKKDGVAVEQIYYSIAAGIAMIFATAVAWITQTRYGNITWPLFVALVVSYMLKDRIKELMRYYFAHKLGNKYYDNKATVTIGHKRVGEIKEGFDFISSAKLPAEVERLRRTSAGIDEEVNIVEEKVMLYRKHVYIDQEALSGNDNYPMRGINEIMRLHLTRFSLKMDNPEVPVDTLDSQGNIRTVLVDKVYYMNVVFNFKHGSGSEYHHFKIAMTRDGVLSVDRM